MSEPVRILVITPTSKLGGTERNIALLADFLPRDRFTLSLATTFGTGDLVEHFRARGLEAEEFRYWENPLRIIALFDYVRRIRPHIIHSFLLRGNWISWALTRFNPEIQWIASERGLDAPRPPWKASANRFFLRTCRQVLAVSEPVREILLRRDGLRADQIEVLTGGIPPAVAALPEPDAWKSLARPRIVTLGHFRPEKNIGLSIRAFAEASRQGLAGSLILIGDGVERSSLEALAQELGVADRVFFAGNLLEGRRLLSHANVLILPSKEEGFPNVILEAWQAGLPVLSTDTPGAREISGPEEAACLVRESELPARLVTLLRSPEELAKLRARGAERVRNFGIEKVIDRLTELYERALHSRS
jgi:glycosyltransferase involved in cell wall biosynthesis